MKNIALALAVLAISASSAFAAPAGCTPAKGNWKNAATYTCPVFDGGNHKREFRDRCEVKS